MPDPRTISLYDAEADAYAKRFTEAHPYRWLDTFVDKLPHGGRVLDLGCGPGTWAARMQARGLTVDALDASAGMVAVAKARHGIDVRLGSFDDVTGSALYDGIWAHFSLLHAPRADLPRHLAALARAMKPGGWSLVAMKLGEGEARDRLGRHYTYYTEEELEDLLATAGFHIVERQSDEGVGFEGTPHRYIVLLAQRP